MARSNAMSVVGVETTTRFSLARDLLDVIAVLHHPRQLDDPVERDLAPSASYLRRAERAHEVAGLTAEPLAEVRQRLHLGLEAPVRLISCLLKLPDPRVVACERILQGRDTGVDLLLPVAQPLFREPQELVVRSTKDVAAQRVERLGEALTGLVQQPPLVLEVLSGRLEPRARLGPLALYLLEAHPERGDFALPRAPLVLELFDECLERRELRAEVRARHEPREGGAQDESDDDQRRVRHGAGWRASGGRRP